MTKQTEQGAAGRFTKKPVTISAVQFTEALRDSIVLDGVPCPAGVKRGATNWHQKDRKVWSANFYIETLEGRMRVDLDDWIITGVQGEHYPCKPDIFAATYEPAGAANPTPEGCGFAQVDLTDDEIDACVGNLGMAPYSVLAGPEEIRKFARKLLAAWAEAAAATSHPTPKE